MLRCEEICKQKKQHLIEFRILLNKKTRAKKKKNLNYFQILPGEEVMTLPRNFKRKIEIKERKFQVLRSEEICKEKKQGLEKFRMVIKRKLLQKKSKNKIIFKFYQRKN